MLNCEKKSCTPLIGWSSSIRARESKMLQTHEKRLVLTRICLELLELILPEAKVAKHMGKCDDKTPLQH